MKWTRDMTEAFRNELTPRASELLDFLASTPGRQYSRPELVQELDLEALNVVNGLFGETTKAIRRAGIAIDDVHSWFVKWEQKRFFSYWLDQQRSDWWNSHPDRKYWTLNCNPKNGYDIFCALKRVEIDWWTTKGSKISVGDRVVIWKAFGGPTFPDNRGIVAFGEVIDGPEICGDEDNPCWKVGKEPPPEEERVAVRYYRLPNGPLWIDGPVDSLLKELAVYRGRRGTVFKVPLDQWENILREAGGWPGEVRKSGSRDWSLTEVRATVTDYLDMYRDELAGKDYSKAEHRRRLAGNVINRTDGAIERKHQNISAVLGDLDLPGIEGYKPLHNYQRALYDEVERQVGADKKLRKLLEKEAEASVSTQPEVIDPVEVFVDPPSFERFEGQRGGGRRGGSRIDFAGREERNSRLGKDGEQFVMDLEKERLVRAGRDDLAHRIVWASRDEGDGLGYDIRSFDEDGQAIYIEVKTTKRGIKAAFFVSENEVETSNEFNNQYRLYRVFNFRKQTQVYILSGPIGNVCELLPIQYKARPCK